MLRVAGILYKRDTDADVAFDSTGEQQQNKDRPSPTSVAEAFEKQATPKLSQNTGDGRVGECLMETLCADSLALCLMAAVAEDQWTLYSASLVCRLWRQVARREELWEAMVRARWRLRRRCTGKYKYGERTWREAYHVFHRMHRLPSLPGVSGKEVVYAQGFSQRVSCWLLVQHQPACRLADKGSDGRKVLLAKLIIQNLRAEPIFLGLRIAGCLSLFLRDGSQSNPQVISSESELLPTLRTEHNCAATLRDAAHGADACRGDSARGTGDGGSSSGGDGTDNSTISNNNNNDNNNDNNSSTDNTISTAGVATAAAAVASSLDRLRAESDVLRLHGDTVAAVAPMQCATVDVGLQAQHQMQFEPDLLEACRLMRVEALALLPGTGKEVDSPIQTSWEHGEAQFWQPIEVNCRFCSEDVVWTHYEQINRGFLVHRDREVANERS